MTWAYDEIKLHNRYDFCIFPDALVLLSSCERTSAAEQTCQRILELSVPKMSATKIHPSYNTMDTDIKTVAMENDGGKSANGSVQEEASLIAAAPKRTWRSYLWDTFDKSPEERRFLAKLSVFLRLINSPSSILETRCCDILWRK